jgi:hypothetical protein
MVARALVLVSLTVLAASPLQATIAYGDFSSTAGLALLGDAAQAGNALRLTPSAPLTQGAAWFGTKQSVAMGFDTVFQFRIWNVQLAGADGIAFVIQNASVAAMGDEGGNMAYGGRPPHLQGIPNSLAVEFDTYRNYVPTDPYSVNDPNDNHISVQSRGTAPNAVQHAYSLGTTTNIPLLSDGQIHTARIRYGSGSLDVFLDNLSTPALVVAVDLGTSLALDQGSAWVGFTSAAGTGGYQTHDVLSWQLATVPEPSAVGLLTLGLAALLRRRRTVIGR